MVLQSCSALSCASPIADMARNDASTGVLTVAELTGLVTNNTIDTVVVGFTDHYGRTMGKRFDADFFLESLDDGTHVCNYLFTVDMEMEPVEGFESANWNQGYGDVHLVPDLATLRLAGWTTDTAIVLCHVHDHDPDTGEERLVPIAPRSILQTQVDTAAVANVEIAAASELEFYLYRDSYREANAKGYRDLQSSGWYVEDYHLLQGARVDDYVGAARRALKRSGIPVENSKGEAAIGQHELNIRYTDAMAMADRHVVMKQGMKELADAQGVSVSFMAKPDTDQPGNSCHIHLSLWSNGKNAFAASQDSAASARTSSDTGPGQDSDDEPDEADGRTDAFRWFLGGWMRHLPDLMPMYAPTVNSYKRYQDESWAPTRIAWSTDNRTAGFRIVGSGQSLRIECRIPGADANPYMAFAAAIASGLDGIANRTEPPDEFSGNVYEATKAERVPRTLEAAVARFSASRSARRLLGDEVVDHYSHFLNHEVRAHQQSVSDWELKRYFERI